MPDAIDVFISYAPADAEHLVSLNEQLAPLRRQRLIAPWDAHELEPGAEIAEIAEHLETAEMILFLVSPSYVASDELWHGQLQRALERRVSDGIRVVPILVRPVDLEISGLGELHPLPADGRPVTSWPDPDAAWVNVEKSLRRMIVRRPPRRARRPRPAVLPEVVPYRVDRNPQLRVLREALRKALETSPPRPVVAVAWGGEGQGQDALVERLIREGMHQMLGLPETRKLHDHLLHWPRYWQDLPAGLLEGLGEEVAGDDRASAAEIDAAWGKDPVLVYAMLDDGDWQRDGASAPRAFAELWRSWPELDAGQALVALLTLELESAPPHALARWLERLGRRRGGVPEIRAELEDALAGDDRIVGVVLPRLRAVKQHDARDWARRTARDYGWPARRLLRPVEACYREQGADALPMDDLTDELRRILKGALFPKEILT